MKQALMYIDLCVSCEDDSMYHPSSYEGCNLSDVRRLRQLISSVYPDLQGLSTSSDLNLKTKYFSDRVILAARNQSVDTINEEVLSQMHDRGRTYFSADAAYNDDDTINTTFPSETLNNISLPGFPLYSLSLKVGTPIILLRNLHAAEGLCNGTRMIITALKDRVIEARILTGSRIGKLCFIPRICLETDSKSGLPFRLRRRQFPIRLAFAMTINKSQGQSLNIVGLHLIDSVFAHGQLYVALSRATNHQSIYILLPSSIIDCSTDNVVYREIFTTIR
jgi:ATP-dependent exoDNAse (exonuclease V) alpha subunit